MARIAKFEVENWMSTYETTPGAINIAETCSASISVDGLRSLSDDDKSASPIDFSKVLDYGTPRGTEGLRRLIARHHGGEGLTADNVVVTQGAISANFLSLFALVGRGDHVVCVYPTFQQLYSLPEGLGAEVTLWRLREENGFVPDVSELAGLVKGSTKMIIINQPNNPSGTRIPTGTLRDIVAFAKERNIILLSDDVYSPLYHDLYEDGADIPPPATSLGYDRAIVTGSMSKVYSLAGTRIGWVVSGDKSVIEAICRARDYTTISVSQLDDQVATYALSDRVRPALLRRNVALARTNVALLADFVGRHGSVCSWVRPDSGTTAFVRFYKGPGGGPVDDVGFCLDVLEKTGVFVVPGAKCFGDGRDFAGYVRIGYVCQTEVLKKGLEKLGNYLEEHHS